LGDGTRNASHFPAKLKVVTAWRDAVSVSHGDNRETEQECDQNDEEDGMVKGSAWRLQRPARVAGHEIGPDAISPCIGSDYSIESYRARGGDCMKASRRPDGRDARSPLVSVSG
jgi:hypothetical protein